MFLALRLISLAFMTMGQSIGIGKTSFQMKNLFLKYHNLGDRIVATVILIALAGHPVIKSLETLTVGSSTSF